MRGFCPSVGRKVKVSRDGGIKVKRKVNGDVFVCVSVVKLLQRMQDTVADMKEGANASESEKGKNLPLLIHVIWWGS